MKGIPGTAHSNGSSLTSQVGHYRVSWRIEASGLSACTSSLPHLLYMSSPRSVIQKHDFSYHCYADDTQLYLYHSFQPDDPMVAARISDWQTFFAGWGTNSNPTLNHNFVIQLGLLNTNPFRTARNLGVVIDSQLNFTGHLELSSAVDLPYTIVGRLGSSFQTMLDLVQARVLSKLDYCNPSSLDRPSSMHCQTSATDPEYCSKGGLYGMPKLTKLKISLYIYLCIYLFLI